MSLLPEAFSLAAPQAYTILLPDQGQIVCKNLFIPVIQLLLCNLTSKLLKTALKTTGRNQSLTLFFFFLLQMVAWNDMLCLHQQSVLFQDETGVDAAASGRRDNPQRGRKNQSITSGTLEALMH